MSRSYVVAAILLAAVIVGATVWLQRPAQVPEAAQPALAPPATAAGPVVRAPSPVAAPAVAQVMPPATAVMSLRGAAAKDWRQLAGLDPEAGKRLEFVPKWALDVDHNAIERLDVGATIHLPVPDRPSVAASIEQRLVHGNGDVSLLGRTDSGHRLVLTLGATTVFATFGTPAGSFEVRGAGSSGLLLRADTLDAWGEGLDDAVPAGNRRLPPPP